jgi:hypothetical protein
VQWLCLAQQRVVQQPHQGGMRVDLSCACTPLLCELDGVGGASCAGRLRACCGWCLLGGSLCGTHVCCSSWVSLVARSLRCCVCHGAGSWVLQDCTCAVAQMCVCSCVKTYVVAPCQQLRWCSATCIAAWHPLHIICWMAQFCLM